MNRSDLLARMARLLKREIGPAVEADYPKTQAFLGAVVLEKMSAELRLADAHAQAGASDRVALVADLDSDLDSDLDADLDGNLADAPDSVREAFAALAEKGADGGDAALCAFIEALYGDRDALGRERFDRLLGRVRQDLRRGIDRRMEIAA